MTKMNAEPCHRKAEKDLKLCLVQHGRHKPANCNTKGEWWHVTLARFYAWNWKLPHNSRNEKVKWATWATGVSKTMKPVKGCDHDDCVDVKYYLFSSSFRFGFQTAELVSEKKNTTQKQVKRGMFPKQFTATQRWLLLQQAILAFISLTGLHILCHITSFLRVKNKYIFYRVLKKVFYWCYWQKRRFLFCKKFKARNIWKVYFSRY